MSSVLGKREHNTVEQWYNVLYGLTLRQAKSEISDTTLQIKVIRLNDRAYIEQEELNYNEYIQQKYIQVSVLNTEQASNLCDNAIVIDILGLGL